MFRTLIPSTPFTSEAANDIFENISGTDYGGDYSFLSTLRALLAPRMKEGDRVSLAFGRSSYSKRDVENNSARAVMASSLSGRDLTTPGNLVIHNLRATQEDNLRNMEMFRDNFEACYAGYHRLAKVTDFYRKSFNVDCYTNPEKKSVLVLVDNLDMKKLHYLQVSILAFMPWYLNPDDGLTDEELALIQSLREVTPDAYLACLAKMAEKYDFRAASIKKLLAGFELRYEQLAVQDVRNRLERIDNDLNEFNRAMGDKLRERNDECIRLLGLEQKLAEGSEESEIMDYFLCNRRLVLNRVDNTTMTFTVCDYLDYFDRDMADRVVRNRTSYVYASGGARATERGKERMKKLMTELFVSDKPRLRVRFCARYKFNLNGNVSPVGGLDFAENEYTGYLPNPHINRYTCLGSYSSAINRLLRDRNYIGAVEQCVASCKSLNFGDSPVMQEFMRFMWGSDKSFIELPDGKVVTPKEAMDWIEKQEAQDGEKEEA